MIKHFAKHTGMNSERSVLKHTVWTKPNNDSVKFSLAFMLMQNTEDFNAAYSTVLLKMQMANQIKLTLHLKLRCAKSPSHSI